MASGSSGQTTQIGYTFDEVTSLQVAVGEQRTAVITATQRIGDSGLTWQLADGTGLVEDKRDDQDGLLRSLNVGDATQTLEQHSDGYDLAS